MTKIIMVGECGHEGGYYALLVLAKFLHLNKSLWQ